MKFSLAVEVYHTIKSIPSVEHQKSPLGPQCSVLAAATIWQKIKASFLQYFIM